MNLWSGRFSKELDTAINDFNSSILFDQRMIKEDLEGSIAHATMLGATGILSPGDQEAIVGGLKDIWTDLQNGDLSIDLKAEDVHLFVETELTKRIGQPGKRLHTARSRNDQVATDLRLYLRGQHDEIKANLQAMLAVICQLAKAHTATVMPGYTHLQRAQPITFAHHLTAYGQMFLRDLSRLADWRKRANECPLGSGALAGTTYPIDRFLSAQLLGFDRPMENSIDGVSDRDFCLELAGVLSIIMVHLSRFSEEMIFWCSWEFRFVELDDSFSTGSSIMPQKKNPDIAELVRGKSGRVFGNMLALFTCMKGLPLAYNKDMQEDKESIFEAVDTVNLCLSAFVPMLKTLTPKPKAMRKAAAGGFINATDCADYLTKKGLPFREAYQITGELVAHCIACGETLEVLSLAEYQAYSALFEADIYEAIRLEQCVIGRNSYGGPAPEAVAQQIANLEKEIEKWID